MGIDKLEYVNKEYKVNYKRTIELRDRTTFVEENPSLLFKKDDIVFVDKNKNVKYFYIYDDLMRAINPNNPKVDNTALLINKFSNIYNKAEVKNIGISEANKNTGDLKNSYKQTHSSINFEAKVNDKLVIGLGGHSVYETDITLHHIYGVPYIPGSALKGSFRDWIINKYFFKESDKELKEKEQIKKRTKEIEQEAMKNESFAKIFGGFNKDDKSVQGQVIFMDSFPLESYTIKRDVMTPHHSKYYTQEEVLPLDSDSVNPISFLVLKDTTFDFNIFIDNFIENHNSVLKEETKLKDFILDELIEMLNYQGLGGKTSAGYGYFDI